VSRGAGGDQFGKERTKKILKRLLRHLAMEKYDCVSDPFMVMASELDFTLRENEEDSASISIAHALKIKSTYLPFNTF
jgi:hypothetical protein